LVSPAWQLEPCPLDWKAVASSGGKQYYFDNGKIWEYGMIDRLPDTVYRSAQTVDRAGKLVVNTEIYIINDFI